MPHPNFADAKRFAVEQLTNNLPPAITYHSIHHTLDEVVPAVDRMIETESVLNQTSQLLLRTAALFHDLGYTSAHLDHEMVSARIVGEVLPGMEYSPKQVSSIQEMIMATRLPQSPQDPLAEILADADLDILGSDLFFDRNRDLRDEMTAIAGAVSDEEWLSKQIKFLQGHHYFTASTRALRNPGKQRNLEKLVEMYQQSLALKASSLNDH